VYLGLPPGLAHPQGVAAMKPDDLDMVPIREIHAVDRAGIVRLRDVARIRAVDVPGAVHRINLYPAIRITGAPPEGKSVAAAAARCVDLAEAELKRLGSPGFAVKNLSAK
jgi:multidrug efflux pump subunit AcrB